MNLFEEPPQKSIKNQMNPEIQEEKYIRRLKKCGYKIDTIKGIVKIDDSKDRKDIILNRLREKLQKK